MELIAYVQAGMRTCAPQISCCYLLFTDQLKINPYIIPFKLICGLSVAIITYTVYKIHPAFAPSYSVNYIVLTLNNNGMPWLHSLSSHGVVLFLRCLSEWAGKLLEWSH